MDNVVEFPTSTGAPRQSQEDAPEVENVFESLVDFVVLGLDEDGNEKFITNTNDFATMVWLIERFKGKLFGYIKDE